MASLIQRSAAVTCGRPFAIVFLLAFGQVVVGSPALAQILPDGSLPTVVNSPDGHNFAIELGSRRGNNLFHSFSQFSIPTGGSAVFNNATDVQNIFSRVTGGNSSNIDGLIQAQGGANLFLLNPSGMIFGPNAALNLGGSFLGSTASQIQFAHGVAFSATNPTPLLTVTVPIGVQFGPVAAGIRVEGKGGTFLRSPNLNTALIPDPQLAGLRGAPGKTLALIGNGIQLDGGLVRAESGQIELGSVSHGDVSLNATGPLWQFSYPAMQTLANIQMTGAALIDASGNPGGAIHLQGNAIEILNSSKVILQHQGPQAAIGGIQINADRVELSGITPGQSQSLVLSENLGQAQGANIQVRARQVLARDGGEFFTATFQNGGNGGNILLQATESIYFSGYAPFNPALPSGIFSRSNRGGGQGGTVQVVTPDLALRDGAAMNVNVFGGHGGGDVQITTDSLSLIGENRANAAGTFIAASTGFGGDAGSLTIEAGRVLLRGGGTLSASTTGGGNAGTLTVHARESIEIDAAGRTVAPLPARISASGNQLAPLVRQGLGLPEFPTGDGGNLFITAPSIKVRNGGYIAAENVGSGNAGTVKIQANRIALDQYGQIKIATTVGNAGNLELTVRDLLLLRHDSLISAKALGQGNGGNVAIDAPIILGLENSDIIANAVQGRGGNIQITTQGIIGLNYRDQLTPGNDITASSEFGVNGTVQVNTIGVDPNAGLTALPVDIVDPSQEIVTGCAAQRDSSFVATGRGGIPENPMQVVAIDRVWSDWRPIANETPTPRIATASMPIEATALAINAQGEIELIGAGAIASNPGVNCSRQ
jgi:filamentous hemagglutinin family protein